MMLIFPPQLPGIATDEFNPQRALKKISRNYWFFTKYLRWILRPQTIKTPAKTIIFALRAGTNKSDPSAGV